ncbi:MAG: hypothetical protein ACYS83_11005 [Planctomycetota bacterium]|jgi:hypothetical protein
MPRRVGSLVAVKSIHNTCVRRTPIFNAIVDSDPGMPRAWLKTDCFS